MNLPILSSKFFDHYSPDLGFFTKWRDIYLWNDQIMPIYEWQDILYVGCVRLPGTLPDTDKKIIFLLCEPEALKKVWYNFEGTVVISRDISRNPDQPKSQQKVAPLKASIPTPIGPEEAILKFEIANPTVPSNHSIEQVQTLSLDMEKQEVHPPPHQTHPELTQNYQSANSREPEAANKKNEIEIQETHFDTDNGISSQKNTSLNTLEISQESFASPEPEAPKTTSEMKNDVKVTPSASPQSIASDPMEALMAQHNASSESSEAFSLEDGTGEHQNKEDSASDSKQDSSEESEGLELLDLGAGPGSPVNINSQASPTTESGFNLEPIGQNAAEEKNKKTLVSNFNDSGEKTLEISAGNLLATEESPTAKPEESPNKEKPPATTEKQTPSKSLLKSPPLEPWAEKVISEVKLEYQKVMILIRNGDQIKPWRWDEDFMSNSPTLTNYSLIPASPFRIVHRTHKSYHGYVVSNEFNQKFFAQWNNDETPEHLTIAPIMSNDILVGMLLAIGKKSADTKGCLQLVEDKAATLSSNMSAAPTAA